MRRGIEYAWCFDRIIHASYDVRITSFDSDCLHAQTADDDRDVDVWLNGVDGPGIIKNIYNMESIFVASGRRLIVNSQVRDELLSSFPRIISRRVRIVRAWNYPFVLGSDGYQNDSAFNPKEFMNGDISKFIMKYECDIPDMCLWEIFTPRVLWEDGSYGDARLIEFVGNKSGRRSAEVVLSQECIIKNYIYRSNSFVSLPELYDILKKNMSFACFWSQLLAL